MSTARDKLLEATAKLADSSNPILTPLADVQLNLEGEGGGKWVFHLGPNLALSEGPGEAQCIVSLKTADFVRLQQAETDAQQLFFSGHLRVEGDLSLAIKLGSLLEALR
jgi:putative sterol carrier protein